MMFVLVIVKLSELVPAQFWLLMLLNALDKDQFLIGDTKWRNVLLLAQLAKYSINVAMHVRELAVI